MKISTKARYGLRAMLELALNFGHRAVHLEEIAREQNLSPKYLHSLLASLKSAGLIHCIRGQSGGYILTRDPERIFMSEVMIALEGPIVFAECVPAPELCAESEGCVTREFWGNLSNAILEHLMHITLGSLARNHARNTEEVIKNNATATQAGCQKSRDNTLNVNYFNSNGRTT